MSCSKFFKRVTVLWHLKPHQCDSFHKLDLWLYCPQRQRYLLHGSCRKSVPALIGYTVTIIKYTPNRFFFFFFFLRKDIRYPLTKILMNKNISQDYKVTHVAAVQPSSHPEGAVLSQVPQSGSAVWLPGPVGYSWSPVGLATSSRLRESAVSTLESGSLNHQESSLRTLERQHGKALRLKAQEWDPAAQAQLSWDARCGVTASPTQVSAADGSKPLSDTSWCHEEEKECPSS